VPLSRGLGPRGNNVIDNGRQVARKRSCGDVANEPSDSRQASLVSQGHSHVHYTVYFRINGRRFHDAKASMREQFLILASSKILPV
jgi:hypothetical protein